MVATARSLALQGVDDTSDTEWYPVIVAVFCVYPHFKLVSVLKRREVKDKANSYVAKTFKTLWNGGKTNWKVSVGSLSWY